MLASAFGWIALLIALFNCCSATVGWVVAARRDRRLGRQLAVPARRVHARRDAPDVPRRPRPIAAGALAVLGGAALLRIAQSDARTDSHRVDAGAWIALAPRLGHVAPRPEPPPKISDQC